MSARLLPQTLKKEIYVVRQSSLGSETFHPVEEVAGLLDINTVHQLGVLNFEHNTSP